MRLRLLLPLLILGLAGGYAAAYVHALRTLDRGPGAGPGEGAAARDALAELRALADPAAGRSAFLERWPESWLRARWSEGAR